MQTIVVKFGGSSLADRGKLLRAAGIIADIARRGDRVAAVVSAQGRTTDRLIARMKEITDHPSEREADLLLSTGELASASLVAMAVCSLGVPASARRRSTATRVFARLIPAPSRSSSAGAWPLWWPAFRG